MKPLQVDYELVLPDNLNTYNINNKPETSILISEKIRQ